MASATFFFLFMFFFVFKQVRVKAKMNSGKEENRQMLESEKRGEIIAFISHPANSGFVFCASCVRCTAARWEINDSRCDLNEHCFPVL